MGKGGEGIGVIVIVVWQIIRSTQYHSSNTLYHQRQAHIYHKIGIPKNIYRRKIKILMLKSRIDRMILGTVIVSIYKNFF